MEMPPYPKPDHEPDPVSEEERFRPRLLLMLAAVLPVAACATALAAAIGRLDTALFFVGVPTLLALVVGLLPSQDGGAQLFQAVTVTLLLVSAFLHEGALCVLIVSPLVYGIAFAIWGLARAARTLRTRWSLGGILLLLALEGAVPGYRISPVHEVVADRVVAQECASFVEALDRGPAIDATKDRGWLLKAAQYPTPTAATGTGFGIGDTWQLAMPTGGIETVVRAADVRPDSGHVVFEVTTDEARTTRWVTLQEGTLDWHQTDAGCLAEMEIVFERDLDPAFWFGPITELFMDAGAAAFLASLD